MTQTISDKSREHSAALNKERAELTNIRKQLEDASNEKVGNDQFILKETAVLNVHYFITFFSAHKIKI